jgi:DNA-binding PadR family transcriptional regulator
MTLAYAILSLLDRSDASGYELMKLFDSSVANFWHATHPQIYRELARLEQNGLVRHKRVLQQVRPNKKVFSITQAGRSELRRWAEESLTSAPQVNDVITLKAMSLPLLPPDQAIARVREWAAIHRKIYEKYKAIQAQFLKLENGKLKGDLGIYLTLLRGLTFEKSHLDWCTMVEEAITAAQRKPQPHPRRGRQKGMIRYSEL